MNLGQVLRCSPSRGDDDHGGVGAPFGSGDEAPTEDLPYRVEIWDEGETVVEQVIAVAAHATIGFAAYYAAAREHPERVITLRHKGMVLSKWRNRAH